MPALSQKQRSWAYAVKGEEWAKTHHYDNPGKLPNRVRKKKKKKLTKKAEDSWEQFMIDSAQKIAESPPPAPSSPEMHEHYLNHLASDQGVSESLGKPPPGGWSGTPERRRAMLAKLLHRPVTQKVAEAPPPTAAELGAFVSLLGMLPQRRTL